MDFTNYAMIGRRIAASSGFVSIPSRSAPVDR